MRQTTLTINTAEVDGAFSDTSETTITPTLEIELTQSGTPKTIYQGTVTIRKDLIAAGSTVPGARDSYYTKTETDAAFASRTGSVAFYGTTPISQQNSGNVVSALSNLGLLSNTGTTYGIVPESTETLTVTTSINFGTINANSTTSVTVSINGVTANDIVLLGLPAALTEGLIFSGHVIAANQIHVDALNGTTLSKTQSAATFRITVLGY
jgi:hypothetical protein